MHSNVPIPALIVEDEQNAKEALEGLLQKFCPEVNVLGWARSVDEAVEQVLQKKPKLLFLDIQLGEEQSFALFNRVQVHDLSLIFTTAYDQFAVDAFRLAAVDYLLKPINPLHLQEAVQKALKATSSSQESVALEALLANFSRQETKPTKITLATAEMVHVVELSSIVKCQSSGNYTVFHFNDTELLVSKTLKEFDDQLARCGFFRAHRSWLINTAFIAGYDKREGGCVVMKDTTRVPVSPAKKDQLLEIIEGLL